MDFRGIVKIYQDIPAKDDIKLLGWQRVAMGVLIVVIVVFFPRGIMGWLRDNWPERFGEAVDEDVAPSVERHGQAS